MIRYVDILEVRPPVAMRVLEWRNSHRVRRGMLSDALITEEEHLRWLDSLASPLKRQMVRVAFMGEEAFGVITLKDIDRVSLRSDWGMYIGDERFLNRGLSKHMLYSLMEWGFEDEGLERLFTSVLASNVGALSLYLRFGFHLEGRFERHIFRDQRWEDVYWIAAFRKRWAEIRDDLKGMAEEGLS
ncbi:pseudaminic acid biosynthesis N-acetyl transferase [Thermanaerovibrio velox DSM 12556]|uniref:Pseudaminic acid biosynthesis N-acetyl transferase n=1 Tax=Thermanaerovibrio velox DSM 12556 TaxID=926567 RepID=H0USI9_9BACT|nr:UDP-4-amino-4,6-dideoxy-N-acetyl-beta-L-altrosamine N-acetyltransferase [Thermanaerovibrio velox]EHM10278.1 pseudaminic acid biosynthesis N-acetyl transferase [Thermanaerovibrio velox DSM 12556]